MIRVYAKEFVTVYRRMEREKCRKRRNCLYAPAEPVREILDRNAYDTAFHKLQLWKRLRWIDTDENHLTKLVAGGEETGTKRRRMYVLRTDVYEALKLLLEETKT